MLLVFDQSGLETSVEKIESEQNVEQYELFLFKTIELIMIL